MDHATCKLCGHEDETLHHALVTCAHAKQFWSVASDYFGFTFPRLHPNTWIQDILVGSYLGTDQLPIAITVLWCVWSSRNKYVHGEEQYKPLGSMQLVEEQMALLELPPRQAVRPVQTCKWSKPPVGWCMVNVDGSLNSHLKVAGSGYIIRNHNGELMEAGCRKQNHVDDPFVSEILAAREGLEAAARLGIPKVIIQTDCLSLERVWREEVQVRIEGAHIISEMKGLCSSFQEVKLLFLGRDANKAAHMCAKEALSVVDFVRFDVIPGFLADVIQSDCNHRPV
jgi:ribonuclease HI